MTATADESEILNKIQDTYVPFLKKIIAFLEKNKKTSPENISKLKAIYTIFTTASSQEQIETFHANEQKLEHWYNKTQKEKRIDGVRKRKKSKQSSLSSDTESSQGACETAQSSAKKRCFLSSVNSESSSDIQQHSENSVPISKNDSYEMKKETAIIQPNAISAPKATVSAPSSGQITFTCASCQFQTHEEAEYMKHARANHKTDLSLWCKECGKCFSNAGVLVTHIKERACIKEDMIYKCGAKDCAFVTTIGQTFVHHLRHCHKRSPFIFCVHCQKIFTLPHCLILHMQDDCPYKERNRIRSAEKGQALNSKPVDTADVTCNVPKPAAREFATSAPRGRRAARGRGRWKGRSRISDSSDSDDADDPLWLSEDSFGGTALRRSARWAKKLNDAMNPEPPLTGGSSSSANKTFSSAELNSKMINCPCCDFMAAFHSVLEDHYIANHKVPNKNACLVCHLKFEDTRSFLNHFEEHSKGLLPNQPSSEVKLTPTCETVSTPVSLDTQINSLSTISDEKEPFDGVLISIAAADFPSSRTKDIIISVPYQAAIHDKNLNDSKLKTFEAFKSPNDLIRMKTIQKLKDFFRCDSYNCSFTTDVMTDFAEHLKGHDLKCYHCCYCLKEEPSNVSMAKHIASVHFKLVYQCSKCFYRACTKAHVQIHVKNYHVLDSYTDILVCNVQKSLDNVSPENKSGPENLSTTWPYACAIGQCDFSTYDPKEFKRHNETVHITTTVFYCRYCKVDFLLFKRLMNHYRLHGLNLFQCNYCIHGTETKEEILVHLCNMHADQPLQAYMRGSKEEVSSEIKELNTVMNQESTGLSLEDISAAKKDVLVENPSKNARKDVAYTGCENELYHVIDNKCYPKHLQSICFPRYLRNLLSDVICGIPFCNEKFQDIHLYISHLRNVHDALNFACPHCPEMSSSWDDFKNHLLCHCSKLYACGSKECEFYDWSKEKIKEHKKAHEDSDCSVFSVRDAAPTNDEYKLHFLALTTEFPDVKNGFICAFCKYESGDRSIMKNHMYREMAYQRFDCYLCEAKCVSRKSIQDHFISSHPDFDISCSIDYNSEVESVVKSVLTEHQKLQDAKLAELCDICCRKFGNVAQLQCHLYICLRKKYRPYECEHCKKCFGNLRALKYHTDKEHCRKNVEYSFAPNRAIEDDVERNLLKVRLRHLKDMLAEKAPLHPAADQSVRKVYACSDCAFEAPHEFNVQRHNEGKHGGMASVTKFRRSCDSSNSRAERYCCGYCVKKMLSVQEVEKHMKNVHTVQNSEYFYYYSPEIKRFSASDDELYECAYCKCSKDNLFLLKKHADLMHSEMDFKVKRHVSCTRPQSNYLACGYCYQRLDNHWELREHSVSSHPLLPLYSVGDVQVDKNNEPASDFPNKRARFDSDVFVCTHCNGAFASLERVTVHSKKSHSRLKLEFTKSSSSARCKFYKCEFCGFTGERQFLDKHLASKHKMRVTCSYCAKRFEFASKLKEHHEIHHKRLPIKYSQETLNPSKASSTHWNPTSTDTVTIPDSPSYCGRLHLSSLTVGVEAKGHKARDLPASHVTERFNMSPRVVLEDVMKKNPRTVT